MLNNIRVLDCTLRDGGYINNWEFPTEDAMKIISNLYEAKVDIIEIGVLGKTRKKLNTTRFQSLEDSEVLLKDKKDDCLYAMMMTFSERKLFQIKERNTHSVDIIRLAFFKPDYQEAVQYAVELIEKGYLVFLQAMASYMYSNQEWKDLLQRVNKAMPYSFYFVDSFGTFYNDDVEEIYRNTVAILDQKIALGFHAHNNIQMAFSNVIRFMDLAGRKNRDIIVDTSVYGMGRGAGNVPTELVLAYLNNKRGKDYQIEFIYQIFERFLKKIFVKAQWGYSLKYVLTSCGKINPGYIWLLETMGITQLNEIEKVLRKIPVESTFSLNKELLKQLVQEEQ